MAGQPELGAQIHADHDLRLRQVHFGVHAADSRRSRLRHFNANAGFKDIGGELALGYTGCRHWGVTGVFDYDRLLGDAEDSPVTKVGSANRFSFGALVTYRFNPRS